MAASQLHAVPGARAHVRGAVRLVSNSRMQTHDVTPDNSDHRLTELEIKISFNEDLLDQLNQVVIRQQQQINALVREVERLHQQIPEAGQGGFSSAGDNLPPHY